MKVSVITLFLVLVCVGGCSRKDEFVFTLPDYRGWSKPVDEVLTYSVPGHGSGARIIYANNKAFSVKKDEIEDGRRNYDFPDGSVVVKEVYTSADVIGSEEPALTIMVKQREDRRAVNGWLYYMKKPGAEMVFVGSRMCSGCHDAANEEHPYFDKNMREDYRDYIFVPF